MTNLDIDALFTNISFDETIDVCINKLFQAPEILAKGISKNDFCDLLNLATKDSFFTFNNKFYIQVDDVAMGSPLDPTLANIFLSHHEENWLNKFPIEFKSTFYRRMLMTFFYILNHLNLPSRFVNIYPLNTRT